MTTDRVSAFPERTPAPHPGATASRPGVTPRTEPRVACPECGTVSVTSAGGRLASDFCPTCDYPLFWARQSDRTAADDNRSPDAQRRAPGVAGTSSVATIACPSCHELNAPEAIDCARCGSPMRPVVVAPPPVPAPQPVIVREEIVCGHRPTWLVVTLTAVPSVALTIGAAMLVNAFWPWGP